MISLIFILPSTPDLLPIRYIGQSPRRHPHIPRPSKYAGCRKHHQTNIYMETITLLCMFVQFSDRRGGGHEGHTTPIQWVTCLANSSLNCVIRVSSPSAIYKAQYNGTSSALTAADHILSICVLVVSSGPLVDLSFNTIQQMLFYYVLFNSLF